MNAKANHPRHSHLRLVPPPPPRPRRLDVRINVTDGRAPYGRSRAFHLIESDVAELVDIATRMEARRA